MLIVGILGRGDAACAFMIEAQCGLSGVPLTILGAFLFRFPVYLVYGLAIAEEIAKCIRFSAFKIRALDKDVTVSKCGDGFFLLPSITWL